jgi:hypothetical protein
MKTIAIILLLAAFAAVALGYIGGTDEGERTATVTSAQSVQTWKSNSPESRISATLEDGSQIATTSPHTPPPKPGEVIVLRVRQTLLGTRSYTWQPGKPPAL